MWSSSQSPPLPCYSARSSDDAPVEVVERAAGRCGELVLRRDGAHYEIVANGVFLMDSRGGASERRLVAAAAERMAERVRRPGRLALGGLGVGFSLAAALADPRVGSVEVVEREEAVRRWNLGPLARLHGDGLRDPRVRCVVADAVDWLAARPAGSLDALCLDVDNGPNWLVTPGNAWLYGPAGLAAAARALGPAGVLAVWSAAPDAAFAARLGATFAEVTVEELPVARGVPDVVYVAGRARGVGGAPRTPPPRIA